MTILKTTQPISGGDPPRSIPTVANIERARLILLTDAAGEDGMPRAALLVPVQGRRPMLRAFATMTAALAAKRALEGAEAGQ